MTHISILVPQRSVLLNSLTGLFRIFDAANSYAEQRGREAAFDIHLVGIACQADLYGGLVTVMPDLKLANVAATDLVIIPALAGDIAEGVKNNSAFIPWIERQYRAGAEIAGLCTGAFFITGAGLIGDRHCLGRWFVEAGFRKQFPQINLVAENTAVDEKSIHSEGGAWSFMRTLLERTAGSEAALSCSAAFGTAFNRECQSVVAVSNGIAKERRGVLNSAPPEHMTADRFTAMFEGNSGNRVGSPAITHGLTNGCNTGRTTLRALVRKIAASDRSYRFGQENS